MSPALTRVDVVVANVVDLARSSTGLHVEDGPALRELPLEAVIVGMPPDARTPGYETRLVEQSGLGRPRYVEEFTVWAWITVTSGDTDLATLRTRAAGFLRTFDEALRDSHVLPGVWDRARLGERAEWSVLQHERGATCNVFFAVTGSGLL